MVSLLAVSGEVRVDERQVTRVAAAEAPGLQREQPPTGRQRSPGHGQARRRWRRRARHALAPHALAQRHPLLRTQSCVHAIIWENTRKLGGGICKALASDRLHDYRLAITASTNCLKNNPNLF